MFLNVILAALVASVAAKDSRTFAVLQHYGKGPLTTCRADPVVSPGVPSSHLHTVMGASNFGLNATGASLRQSQCTTARPKADLSAYWFPTLFFKDPIDGHFEQVEFFYMNVYYFFEATNDKIKSFPVGLKMLSGNAQLRTAPTTTGATNMDPSKGPIQPASITCPRSSYDPPSYPVNSDGSMAGMVDPNNKGEGIGFPFQDCDGYASPMRVDLHFPSCYNPALSVEDYKNNMQFPTDAGSGKQDCPAGWIHTPHVFFETYWNTHKLLPRFQSMIGKESPFVFANGDVTGFSAHGDMISGWDEAALQQIIDNCDAGHAGMHTCPGLIGGVNDPSGSCNIECPVDEAVSGNLTKLPGNNPLAGWKYGTAGGSGAGSGTADGTSSSVVQLPSTTAKSSVSSASSPPATTLVTSSKSAVTAIVSTSSKSISTPPIISSIESALPVSGSLSAPVPSVTGIPTTSKVIATASTELEPVSTVVSGGKTSTVWDTTTVWQTTTVYGDATASAGSSIAGLAYAGCYKDASNRVLAGEIRPNLGRISNTLCVTYCASKGWAIAGTEYGGQCYCGNSLTTVEKLAESECSLACEGRAGETCGGSWALSVYTKGGVAPSAAQKRHEHNHFEHHRRSAAHAHRRR
ncbi:hypothetical protein B0T17DRAFT_616304 [Bombardia bombarda]|uniref:WSC domain-containing protein n=1 Tax=Bombardia bombarda TaxID=252184 RepID=A0AA39XBI9_9PEZI|nr:hypothetical protein B0T17DRAFT_616304 [Bombardia bombarda]